MAAKLGPIVQYNSGNTLRDLATATAAQSRGLKALGDIGQGVIDKNKADNMSEIKSRIAGFKDLGELDAAKGDFSLEGLRQQYGSAFDFDKVASLYDGQDEVIKKDYNENITWQNTLRDEKDKEGVRQAGNDFLGFNNRAQVEEAFKTPGAFAAKYNISEYAANKLKEKWYGQRTTLDAEENRIQGINAQKRLQTIFNEYDLSTKVKNLGVLRAASEQYGLPFNEQTGELDFSGVSDTEQREIEDRLVNSPGGLQAEGDSSRTYQAYIRTPEFQALDLKEQADITAAYTSAHARKYGLIGDAKDAYEYDIAEGNRQIELDSKYAEETIAQFRSLNPTSEQDAFRRNSMTMASVDTLIDTQLTKDSWMDIGRWSDMSGGTELKGFANSLNGKRYSVKDAAGQEIAAGEGKAWMIDLAIRTVMQTSDGAWGNPTASKEGIEAIVKQLATDTTDSNIQARIAKAREYSEQLLRQKGQRQQRVIYEADKKHKPTGAGTDIVRRNKKNIQQAPRVGTNAVAKLDAAVAQRAIKKRASTGDNPATPFTPQTPTTTPKGKGKGDEGVKVDPADQSTLNRALKNRKQVADPIDKANKSKEFQRKLVRVGARAIGDVVVDGTVGIAKAADYVASGRAVEDLYSSASTFYKAALTKKETRDSYAKLRNNITQKLLKTAKTDTAELVRLQNQLDKATKIANEKLKNTKYTK